MNPKKKKHVDPLFQLFESYLLTRSYEDAATFTKALAKDYMAYLDSTPAHVPLHLRASVLEDLELESHEMLVRKMYGVVTAADYQNRGKVITADEDAFEWIDLNTGAAPDDQPKD